MNPAVQRGHGGAAGGRVRARSPSSANKSSKVFTASDCFTSQPAKSRRF
ncbi:hypothetical protein I552_4146 [Mycobacterium xenopi 3993]|nr:hypothetical protein I552_4146 [Mycobacterium xenopi 3993]